MRRGSPRGRRAARRFSLVFSMIVVASFVLIYVPPIERFVVMPFMSVTASAVGWILGVLGEPVTSNALTLSSPQGSITIAHGCDVTFEWIVYVAAVAAFPASWRSRGWGLFVGLSSIFTLNLARVVSLYYVLTRRPAAFEFVHAYLWQALFMILVFVVWGIWARMAVRREAIRVAPTAP